MRAFLATACLKIAPSATSPNAALADNYAKFLANTSTAKLLELQTQARQLTITDAVSITGDQRLLDLQQSVSGAPPQTMADLAVTFGTEAVYMSAAAFAQSLEEDTPSPVAPSLALAGLRENVETDREGMASTYQSLMGQDISVMIAWIDAKSIPSKKNSGGYAGPHNRFGPNIIPNSGGTAQRVFSVPQIRSYYNNCLGRELPGDSSGTVRVVPANVDFSQPQANPVSNDEFDEMWGPTS